MKSWSWKPRNRRKGPGRALRGVAAVVKYQWVTSYWQSWTFSFKAHRCRFLQNSVQRPVVWWFFSPPQVRNRSGGEFPRIGGRHSTDPTMAGDVPYSRFTDFSGMVGSTLVLPGEGRSRGGGLQTAGNWTKSWVWASHSTLVLKCGWELKGHPTNSCRFCWGETQGLFSPFWKVWLENSRRRSRH